MALVDFSKRLYDVAMLEVAHIRFNKTNPYHRGLVLLYLRQLEFFDSIIFLARERKKAGVPVIFRSLLEVYVEFKNLHADPKYGYQMEANNAKELLKLLQEAQHGNNQYLVGINTLLDFPSAIAQIEGVKNYASQQGESASTIRSRFEKAGMGDVYVSMYNLISSESHSNLAAMIQRYSDATDALSISLSNEFKEADYVPYLLTSAAYFLESGIKIHEFFDSGRSSSFQSLSEELDGLGMKYAHSAQS